MSNKFPLSSSALNSETPKVATIIVSSPIPSHPSTEIILKTLRSIHLTGYQKNAPIYVLLDGLKLRDVLGKTGKSYREYMRRLETTRSEFPGLQLIRMRSWGHISQSLRRGLRTVTSEYVLVLQHDMPFIQRVDLARLIDQMDSYPEIRHVRFNLQQNVASGADARYTYKRLGYNQDRSYYFEPWKPPCAGEHIPVIKTLCWSDNNHVCKRDYLLNIVLKPIGRLRMAPEWPMNRASTDSYHEVLGTYVIGSIGDQAVIAHSDGRQTPSKVPNSGTKWSLRILGGHKAKTHRSRPRIVTEIWRTFHDLRVDFVVQRTRRIWDRDFLNHSKNTQGA